jgi:hypothetical protein
MSKRVKYVTSNEVGRGTPEKRRNGMLWEEEVPHEIRKNFFLCGY